MDFRVAIQAMMVIILPVATPAPGGIRERDTSQRATCTAPVATKGETAEVTCHYPLNVKQPGKMVAVSVERYPFISANTGFPSSDFLLDCMWHEDLTCTLDKEEHRVEGKDVVITIKNVTEDNQGRYLCQMMVKDGPNIHGETCRLLVNDTNPSDPLPSMTDPALDQPTTTDNETSSGGYITAGTIAGCALLLAIVTVVVVTECKRRKQCRNKPVSKPANEVVEGIKGRPKDGHLCMERGEHQHQHPGPEILGARGQGDNDDDNRGDGPPAERDPLLVRGENQLPYPDPDRPGAPDERHSGDVSHGDGHPEIDQNHSLEAENPKEQAPGDNDNDRENGPAEERDPLWGRGENQLPYQDPDRSGARDERNNGDDNHGNGPSAEGDLLLKKRKNQLPYQDPERPGAPDKRNNGDDNHDDRDEGRVLREVEHIENMRRRSTPDMSDDRPEGRVRREVKHIENMRSRSTSDMRPSNEMEETENAYGEEEKEDDANETGERQDRKQDEKDKEDEENVTEKRQEKKQNEDEKEDEGNKMEGTEEKKKDEKKKKNEGNEGYSEDDDDENKGDEEEVEDAVERGGGGAGDQLQTQ